MGKTLTHEIPYPDGGGVPNAPVAMQALAEGTDKAISRISEAPSIVCNMSKAQNVPNGGAVVNWTTDLWKQGITHDPVRAPGDFVIEEEGLYTVNAKVALGFDKGGIILRINGVERRSTWVDAASVPGTAPKPTSITDHYLKPGDLVQVHASGPGNLIWEESFLSIRKSAGFAPGAAGGAK